MPLSSLADIMSKNSKLQTRRSAGYNWAATWTALTWTIFSRPCNTNSISITQLPQTLTERPSSLCGTPGTGQRKIT